MLKDNYKIYQEQSDVFAKTDYWRSDEEIIINDNFRPQKDRKLLVLGCGGGRTLPHLLEKGFKITAIDIVDEMVEAAKNKMAGSPVSINKMDATDLKYPDNEFDYVFFPFHGIDCIYPDIYACVREVRRVLKGGGVFIFNSHNRFFIKKLNKFFAGPYLGDQSNLKLYRTTPLDRLRLKRYFVDVKVRYRISFYPWSRSNWKDIVYKILPWFSKSVYFICKNPRT